MAKIFSLPLSTKKKNRLNTVSPTNPIPIKIRDENLNSKKLLGAIIIAKKAGFPIVPVYWYSPNFTFLKFPSWDGFRMPCVWTKLINIYGEPIYVDPNGDREADELVRLKVQHSLEELEEKAPEAHKKVFRFGIWKK